MKFFTFFIAAVAVFWFTTAARAYEIGHTTMSFKDAVRRINIPAEIYYPADSAGENVPVSSCQFPLLIFGHGYRTPIP